MEGGLPILSGEKHSLISLKLSIEESFELR
ncbi:hypothetical protein MBMB1_0399 [Methanobacterium sp. MB1]|nr:hypothetical protein MBMB1_0399 [Methanobacterium sp. MB1]